MKRKRDPASLVVKPVPVPVGACHPPVPNDSILPQHEFTMGVIAPKGSGKTTWIANMLDFYAGYFHTIVVFSPTLHSDDKWDYVRKRPLLGENKALKKFLEKKKQADNAVVGDPHIVDDHSHKKFDPHIPDDCFMPEYDDAALVAVIKQQDEAIKELEKMGATKHLANRLLMIFDDLVGSALFTSRRDDTFKGLNTRHRHYSCSIMMVTQGYKEIPKTIRTNFTGLVVFEIPSANELKAIREENPVGLKNDMWDRAYEFCVEGDYSFMYINYVRPKTLRIMRNFDQFVWYE